MTQFNKVNAAIPEFSAGREKAGLRGTALPGHSLGARLPTRGVRQQGRRPVRARPWRNGGSTARTDLGDTGAPDQRPRPTRRQPAHGATAPDAPAG
eukprot:2110209-Pyramimonas_sp.AAC.1